MKNIFISILMILVFNCGGGGGSSTPTNCEQCVYNSIADFINGGLCDASDLNASGCINMIEFGDISNIDNIHEGTLDDFFVEGAIVPDINISPIYYNTDFNITGFQFDIQNIENISVHSAYNFTIVSSEPESIDGSRILGYTLDASIIPSGCGILMYIVHNSGVQPNYEISNIIFTDDTINDDLSPNIMDVCPL